MSLLVGYRQAGSLSAESGRMPTFQDDALDMRVNVERWWTQKSNQRLIAFTCEINRESGRRRDSGDDRNARRQRFLHDFEGSAAADE